jgi:hypothetical protein
MMAAFEDEEPVERMHVIRQRYAFPMEGAEDLDVRAGQLDLVVKICPTCHWRIIA